ncbi:hypothetical protein H6P81_007563 [Aristolochia fimbriata]|uniref:Uncharacterized protein n=1 Tax=Aristolochia fimbriata TaxID=158543 RepID=A0AAV7F1W9_ARIFI|nr:hypothetical protein H6P81_007563 [Aristolochia fimbriata]
MASAASTASLAFPRAEIRRSEFKLSTSLRPQSLPFSCKSLDNTKIRHTRSFSVKGLEKDADQKGTPDDEASLGVRAALSMLKFYKREISPLLPASCRYVPSCSEYSMIAYQKYGVIKGTVLTAWRLCRCNPLGGSGFDPPRWFDEPVLPED